MHSAYKVFMQSANKMFESTVSFNLVLDGSLLALITYISVF